MPTTQARLVVLALAVPTAALSGLAVVLACKIVKRGPKDYRRGELIDGGRGIRIDLDDYTQAPGEFGVFDPATETYIGVGDVTLINEDKRYVERRIKPAEIGLKRLGPMVDWTPDVFFVPAAVSSRYEQVNIPTSYGMAPAWLFEGDNPDVWVIHIHGNWSDRSIMFRDVQAFKSLGFTSLVPSFGSDPEVSPPQTRASHLGQTEWCDVECAVAYAVTQGARRIILSGWSMGGTIALLTAERSVYREQIAGIVLVGPVTSWRKTITASAARAGVPAFGAGMAMELLQVPLFAKMLGLIEPLDFDALEWVETPNRVNVPTLVLHSNADQEVPWELSEAFQRANPHTVTLVQLPGANHTQEWNAAPRAFTHEVTSWVRKVILDHQV